MATARKSAATVRTPGATATPAPAPKPGGSLKANSPEVNDAPVMDPPVEVDSRITDQDTLQAINDAPTPEAKQILIAQAQKALADQAEAIAEAKAAGKDVKTISVPGKPVDVESVDPKSISAPVLTSEGYVVPDDSDKSDLRAALQKFAR